MTHMETYTSGLLQIEIGENDSSIEITFLGKSTEREPGKFITPILSEVIQNSRKYNKGVSMNFLRLEYMNSSTITPIIRILENTKKSAENISILYDKTKKWQELCFTALKIFETKDGRIKITGS